MELAHFLANLHPFLVHFPIVFWLAALTFDGVGFLAHKDSLRTTGKILLALGTVTALYAVVCGIFAETFAARAGIPTEPIETHEFLALVSTWGFALLTLARFSFFIERKSFFLSYLFVGTGLCVILIFSAYLGGQLVHHYGAGVETARLPYLPSPEDLTLLAQQQTPETIAYSQFMHHVFGWLVLGLALLLLAQVCSLQFFLRKGWLAPALLVGGGLFLMVFSDQDSWPLKTDRSVLDKEVLFHKTIALLLVVAGFLGLLRSTTNRLPVQAGIVAFLALLGGALLFTHLHSVAPYANVALGVYLHHILLGTIALAIGAAKLLEKKFPRTRLLFPLLILTESIFLIQYNEGLPWFLGYQDYRHTSLEGGVLAGLGDGRAELQFDPATQKLNVHFFHALNDIPLALTASNISLQITQGQETTEVPLQKSADPSRFLGSARFLRDAQLFTATLRLSLDSSAPVNLRLDSTAYFEPWVSPQLNPLPLIGTSQFACPMHESVQSHTAGTCPICQMALVNLRTLDPSQPDSRYKMHLHSLPAPPLPNQTITLRLTPNLADDQPLTRLQVVHEKLMHLLIIRDDFTFFDHVHPEQQSDGSFLLPYQFSTQGRYLLFSNITPTGDRTQTFRLPLTVGTPTPSPPVILHPDPILAREFDGIRTQLTLNPPAPKAGRETTLAFSLSQHGQPLTTLKPWLGAMGHCMALSEDTQTFLHFHPLNTTAPNGQIIFHARFPHPGLYKLWAQFRPEDNDPILTVDFVISVP